MMLNRREFIKAGSAGLASIGLAGQVLAEDRKFRSTVALIRDKKAIDERNKTDKARGRGMVKKSLQLLTSKNNEKDCWTALGLAQKDVVAIKLNCCKHNFPLFSHTDLTYAVCESLASVVPENNIIIFERYTRELEAAGYKINDTKKGVRCHGTDRGSGFDEKTKITNIVAKEATKVINIPSLKYAGGAFQGSIFIKGQIGSIIPDEMSSCHGNPMVCTRLMARPDFKDKTIFNICDALRATYEPKTPWYDRSIIASADPIAAEAVSLDIMAKKRKEKGLEPVTVKDYIKKADSEYNLGTASLDQIRVLEKETG
jgi:hypothetical protein